MNNEEKILQILEQMNGRLDSMDGRLDSMDGRLDSMDGRLSNLETEFGTMRQEFGSMQQELTSVRNSVTRMENTLPRQISLVAEGHIALNRNVEDLKERMRRMEDKMDEAVIIKVAQPLSKDQ